MRMRELLSIAKPRLSESDRSALRRRRELTQLFEACKARLESIETLVNGAPADALILCRELQADLLDLFAALDSRPRREPGADTDALQDPAISDRLRRLQERLDACASDTVAQDRLYEIVKDLRRALGDARRSFWRLRSGTLATPLDAYRLRVWVQLTLAAGLVVVLTASALAWQTTRYANAKAEFDRLYNAGVILGQNNMHNEAIEVYRGALQYLPDDPEAAKVYNNLGWSLAQLGRYDEAIEAYEAALRLMPGFTLARNNLQQARLKLE